MFNLIHNTDLLYWTIYKHDLIHPNNDCPTLVKILEVLTSARTNTRLNSAVIWGPVSSWFWCNLITNFFGLLYIIWWSVGGFFLFSFPLRSDSPRWKQTVSPKQFSGLVDHRGYQVPKPVKCKLHSIPLGFTFSAFGCMQCDPSN